MSLREDVELYTKLSGEDGSQETIATIGAYLRGYGQGKEDAEPHWISVTKDTPKEAGTYMCTCYDAGRRIVTLVKWQPRTKTWNLTGARAYWKVIAWCELPEPFKGVTE